LRFHLRHSRLLFLLVVSIGDERPGANTYDEDSIYSTAFLGRNGHAGGSARDAE
jgi:hypothetical protein